MLDGYKSSGGSPINLEVVMMVAFNQLEGNDHDNIMAQSQAHFNYQRQQKKKWRNNQTEYGPRYVKWKSPLNQSMGLLLKAGFKYNCSISPVYNKTKYSFNLSINFTINQVIFHQSTKSVIIN